MTPIESEALDHLKDYEEQKLSLEKAQENLKDIDARADVITKMNDLKEQLDEDQQAQTQEFLKDALHQSLENAKDNNMDKTDFSEVPSEVIANPTKSNLENTFSENN